VVLVGIVGGGNVVIATHYLPCMGPSSTNNNQHACRNTTTTDNSCSTNEDDNGGDEDCVGTTYTTTATGTTCNDEKARWHSSGGICRTGNIHASNHVGATLGDLTGTPAGLIGVLGYTSRITNTSNTRSQRALS
jgi:hypothetical protein